MENTLNNRSITAGNLTFAVAELMRCVQLRNENRLHEALAQIDKALSAIPHFLPGLVEKASILAALFRFEESLSTCRTLLAYAPTPEHKKLRDQLFVRAQEHYSHSRPEDRSAEENLLRLGNIHLLAGRYAAAIDRYQEFLRTRPQHHDALQNLAYALSALNRNPEAKKCYEQLLEQDTHDADNYYNYGNVLKAQNHLDSAVSAYQRATWLKPDFAEAQLELAHCLLAAGHFSAGWRQFEWRWRTPQLKEHYLASSAPAWLGESDLDGKTILLWAEQGFGDTLQFIRFAPCLADLARSVLVRIPAPLSTLLQPMDARLEFIDDREPLPQHDAHCPLMSLPLALGIAAPQWFHEPAYLTSDGPLGDKWSAWLGPRIGKQKRIGIVWAGRRYGRPNPTRDIPIDQLKPLWDTAAEFICLHRDIAPGDANALRQQPNLRFPGLLLTDFAETAALIDQLDLVISVDSAVAHLAGALGKPCWLLLRQSGEWRWQLNRDDSPWYPSLRLYRQRNAGQWNEVVRRVVEDIGR